MKPSEQCQHITQTRALFSCPDGVSEIRATKAGPYKNTTYSGYFTALSEEAFLEGIHACAKQKPSAIYVTLNPIHPDALARCANRIDRAGSGDGAKDNEILHRRWILVDADTIRLANISATEEEHTAGIERATAIRDMFLKVYGVATVLADSGNGAHCLIPCSLPNDEESKALVIGVLTALQAQFGDDVVKIDTGVFNAARICKAYGTLVRKGDNTELRPHRYAQLIDVPSALPPVSVDILRALAGLAKPTSAKPSAKATRSPVGPGSSIPTFDVPAFLAKHGIPVHHEEEGAMGWHQWALEACPFNPDHRAPDAMVSQQAGTGKVSFKCLHNSCRSNKWQEFRKKFEVNWTPYEERTYQGAPTPRAATVARSENAKQSQNDTGPRPLTDIGNAERLIDMHGLNVRYCAPNREWYTWNGKIWEQDQTGQIDRFAKATVRNIYTEAGAEDDDKQRREIIKHAQRSESNERIKALLARAEKEEGVGILPRHFDADPWLLACNNGTLDLKTGTLRPHNRTDLITKLTAIDYDAKADCPQWDRFLARVVPDEAVRTYLHRAMGYSLTGDIRAQCLFFLWGGGQNGKSTVIFILEQLLGAYLKKTPAEVLMRSMSDGCAATPDIADLHGKRVATVSEIQKDRRLNEALVKDLTGGDSITARRLHRDPFTFEPTHKVWLAGNHKPVITGGDDGIWRRVKLIPFTVRIPDEEKDESLRDKLRDELPGILRRVVTACLEWQRQGLGEPAAVKQATQQYKSEMDIIGMFIDDCCIVNPKVEGKASELRTRYEIWCGEVGEKVSGTRSFYEEIGKRFEKKHTREGNIYIGIRRENTQEEAKKYDKSDENAQNVKDEPPVKGCEASTGVSDLDGTHVEKTPESPSQPFTAPNPSQKEFIAPLSPSLLAMIEAAKTNKMPTGIITLADPHDVCEDVRMRVTTVAARYSNAQTEQDAAQHLAMLQRCFNALYASEEKEEK